METHEGGGDTGKESDSQDWAEVKSLEIFEQIHGESGHCDCVHDEELMILCRRDIAEPIAEALREECERAAKIVREWPHTDISWLNLMVENMAKRILGEGHRKEGE